MHLVRLAGLAFFGAGAAGLAFNIVQQQRARLELELPLSFDRRGLKAAFRRASLGAHPDKGGTEASFVRVTDAYRRLSALGPDGDSSVGRLAVAMMLCWICCSGGGVSESQRLRREKRARKRRERRGRRREQRAAGGAASESGDSDGAPAGRAASPQPVASVRAETLLRDCGTSELGT